MFDRSADLERCVIPDHDRTDHDIAAIKLDEAKVRVLPERDVVADVEEVPPAAVEVDTAMNVHAAPDARAQQA